ncbi:MAG: MFS transporter [Myxococcota bacterium]
MRDPIGPDIPFSPKQWPIYYGWIVVGAATIGIVASIPGQTMGVSVFTDALLEATGLTRLSVSNAYLIGTVLSGLTLPLGGTYVDRFGARIAGAAACVGLGVHLVYLSQIDRISRWMAGDHLGLSFVLLTAGFFGLRLTGQGLLTMTCRTMLGRWFEARRGMVAGLSGLFIGFGFGLCPQVFDAWIRYATWRGAWLQMAAVIVVGMGSIVIVFFRDSPEVCGLQMDGRDEPSRVVQQRDEIHFSRSEALRTGAFWAVTFALAAQAMMITGITFHIVDIGAAVGVAREDTVTLFLPIAAMSVISAVVGGTMGDRLPVRALLIALMISLGIGIYGIADLAQHRSLAILGLGLATGLAPPTSTIAYPRFFGRRHLGAIVGVEMMALVIGSALGPSFLASSRVYFGEYRPLLMASLSLPMVSILLSLGFSSPTRRPRSS